MAKFEKGNKAGKGRPKGSQNKKNKENRERVSWCLSILEESLEEDLRSLSASEKVKTYTTLLEYALPKLQRVAHTGPNDEKLTVSFDLSTLTDDELNKLEGITAKLEGDKGGEGKA